MTSHPIWPCNSYTADQCLKACCPVSNPRPLKNVIYTENWHLDELQSPHMGTVVSSSHQAKNQPLFSVSRFALVGDDVPTITSIHEARALGSARNNSSLSCRKQGNSCRVFPVMLLIFKCCSLVGVGGIRTQLEEGSDLLSWLLLQSWTNCSKRKRKITSIQIPSNNHRRLVLAKDVA